MARVSRRCAARKRGAGDVPLAHGRLQQRRVASSSSARVASSSRCTVAMSHEQPGPALAARSTASSSAASSSRTSS